MYHNLQHLCSINTPSKYGNIAEVTKEFWIELENQIKGTLKGSTPIVGGDINAHIGNRLSHPPSNK
jgi:hypothetical protein